MRSDAQFSIAVVVAAALPFLAKAQEPYGYKEKFDGLHSYFTSNVYTYTTSNTNWFLTWGWTLQGYLRMYQTTGDQAYLIKFIEHSYGLQARRGPDGNDDVLWMDNMLDTQWLHYSSEMSKPMAEYAYMVMTDPELFQLPIPSAAFATPVPFATHGEYAEWLQWRTFLTLNQLVSQYWITYDHGACKDPVSACERDCVNNNCIHNESNCPFLPCGCVHPAQVNVHADLAGALYYLAASYSPADNGIKSFADAIAEYFKYYVEVMSGTNAKVWHASPEDATPTGRNQLEDAAHGASSVQIPLISFALHGTEKFSNVDMSQFASTFSDNIWDVDNGYYQPNVHGLLSGPSDGDDSVNFFARADILSWMPLELFDENTPPNDVYSLLALQARLLLENDAAALVEPGFDDNAAYLSGPQSYYGLSEVVKAQWRRECADLTLYNRDLVYDQDFAVMHVLTVEPLAQENPNGAPQPVSFADPIITDPHFTVREGITSQFRAGAAVVWEPGFEAEYGSHVEAVIDPAGCEMIVHMGLHGSGASANEDKRVQFPADAFARDQARLLPARIAPSPQTTMRLVPNPSVGLSTLEVSLHENAELRWDLLNGLGQRVASSSPVLLTAGTHALPMDAAGLAPGTYVLSVWVNGKPEQLRLVLATP